MTIDSLGTVQDIVVRIAKIARPDPDSDLFAAGLQSVDALELLLELEDAFGVAIPDDRFVAVRTARGLADLVNDLRAGDPQ